MRCWNLFGHPHLNYSSGPATVVNCNLNSQLMHIQLIQQTLVCFTALTLNILYPHPCLHVFMSSRGKPCLLKPPLSWGCSAQEKVGGYRQMSNILSWKSCGWPGWEGPGRGGPERSRSGLRSHSGSKTQTGFGVLRWFPLPNLPQVNWCRGLGTRGSETMLAMQRKPGIPCGPAT